ncbi:hypothetical protein KR009_003751 [Drosophila setifemur]|nr:hypothetical protein KR009_003751 [Drosophila setifemur]
MSCTIRADPEIFPLSEAKRLEAENGVDSDSPKKKEPPTIEQFIDGPLKIVEPFEQYQQKEQFLKQEQQEEQEQQDQEEQEQEPPQEEQVTPSKKEDIPTDSDVSCPTLERRKAKKSVSFNPNEEKEIRKFTTGEPIVDQKNPFRNGHVNSGREKKTPPPVPTKRSTLSVRKTVTQQLREREREREKEKEREQLKNEANARGNKVSKVHNQIDDYITKEEVLKQSKYVKTYIKNPDAYFVFDPTVLARLKFEELKELKEIPNGKPKRKQAAPTRDSKNQSKSRNQAKATEAGKPNPNTNTNPNSKPPGIAFKKCSKPNYPELANLKIRTGTEPDPNGQAFLNSAEVTKNARKFDERVKKLQISSDDDLDEIDGPLTKSESSDELAPSSQLQSPAQSAMSGDGDSILPSPGTFTNTISSEEFQSYLDRKGLALMPKRELTTPTATPTATPTGTPTATPTLTPSPQLLRTREERRQQVAESLAALRKSNTKKLSVLQRLSNSLFPPRRKTMPQPATNAPRSLYGDGEKEEIRRKPDVPAEMRRILLERQNQQQNQNHSPNHNPNQNHSPNPNPNPGQAESPSRDSREFPLQRSAPERQSLIPRRVSPEEQPGRFARSASMQRSQIRSLGQRRSLAAEQLHPVPLSTSTPIRRGANEWEQLRAIKEVTDRQLYHKVLQQQQNQHQHQLQRQSEENIYEHLQPHQLLLQPGQQPFIRGASQRNTFSGISGRHRQVMILDGTPILPIQQMQQQPPRCQSQLDNMVSGGNSNPGQNEGLRRGYESESEAPVVMRRRETSSRRIGGLLTREEILEKVKEFCRKSISRTPVPAPVQMQMQMQPIYERQATPPKADISPVSYACVDDHSARPQVPLRVQSLPVAKGRFPAGMAGVAGVAGSPIYAHVNKRGSLLSNDSEQYLSSQHLGHVQDSPVLLDQYVLVETEKGVQAAQLVDYHPGGIYVPQPQVRMHHPHPQRGYVLQDGRATPLILGRSGQQDSQIYWTPQHQQLLQQQHLQQQLLQQHQHQQQQLQQRSMTMTMPTISSRGGHPVAQPRLNVQGGRVQAGGEGKQYFTLVPAPRNLTLRRQPQARNVNVNASDWELSSEAGEVQRIMEKHL